MMLKILKIKLILMLLVFASCSFAMREPRATFMDSRIRVMNYNPNDVFKYIGYYGYQGSIELEAGEEVDTISMGDTSGWQIVPSGNRMFLKPIAVDATTNMTLITNKRMYFFELHAAEAKSINDPQMSFIVKFLYPNNASTNINLSNSNISSKPDLSKPGKYNFKYTISGSEKIAPIKIFDDGKFTYLEFRDKNAPMPAVFEVDNEGEESIINYQTSGDYILIEMVASKFTLRYGGDVTCIFNELNKEK